MKTIPHIFAIALFPVVAPNSCFALSGKASVSKERAKELDMEVRSEAADPNHVRVEFECKTEGALKNLTHVDLLFGQGDNPPVTAHLREDRSKPGRVVVSFTAAVNC